MKLKTVDIVKSTKEYYRKKFLKSGHKMDLYLAMFSATRPNCCRPDICIPFPQCYVVMWIKLFLVIRI